jgi:hypothetical protein
VEVDDDTAAAACLRPRMLGVGGRSARFGLHFGRSIERKPVRIRPMSCRGFDLLMLTDAHRGELLTVDQVAAQLGLHPMTAGRRFASVKSRLCSSTAGAPRSEFPTQALISTLQRSRTGPTEEPAL